MVRTPAQRAAQRHIDTLFARFELMYEASSVVERLRIQRELASELYHLSRDAETWRRCKPIGDAELAAAYERQIAAQQIAA